MQNQRRKKPLEFFDRFVSLISLLSFLQEGAGAAALAAFVELVFDNTDNRFPVSLFHFFY